MPVTLFQACSNRIPYSGVTLSRSTLVRFKPVRTGFPIRESIIVWRKSSVSSLFEQDSLFGPIRGIGLKISFKPVRTGFPIREFVNTNYAQYFVSSLFEQDSLFGIKKNNKIAYLFQACSNRIPYSGVSLTEISSKEFQACSNRIPYSG